MNAYIYTWNPSKWKWIDLPLAVSSVNSGEEYARQWSCGRTRKPRPGDLFVLMKLGSDPGGSGKGIAGCGHILSEPDFIPHWDEEKAALGESVLSTAVSFKALSDIPILALEALRETFPRINWTPQQSGTSLPMEVAMEIFERLAIDSTLNESKKNQKPELLFEEGDSREITIQSYDRSSRAREACINHYGYKCSICNFSFEEKYGAVGHEYIEVHHLRQIADIGHRYLIDPVKDLRPVCANCHRMLHRTRQSLAIEQLISSLPKK